MNGVFRSTLYTFGLYMLAHDDPHRFMRQALKEAEKAFHMGEVPIGAVVVCNNQIIARGHNTTELLKDTTAHAEMIAITAASAHLGSKYLKNCQMYVTLEPCVMCSGAIKWSQLSKVVYGAPDDKNGFMKYGKGLLHPKTVLEYGIMQDECLDLLKSFFVKRRKSSL